MPPGSGLVDVSIVLDDVDEMIVQSKHWSSTVDVVENVAKLLVNRVVVSILKELDSDVVLLVAVDDVGVVALGDVVLIVAVDGVGVVALDDVNEDDGGLESSLIHLVFLFLGIL